MNPDYRQTGDWRTLSVIAALHAVALLALLSLEPVAEAVGLPRPLLVSLLAAAEPEPPKELPKPLPPSPQVLPVQQVQPPPVLVAREEAPTPIAVSAPLPTPVSSPTVPSAPTPEPPMPVAAAVAAPPPVPITPPRFDADYLDNPAPAYPALSRRLGEHGRVLLRVFVSPDGNAAQVEVRESSGYERLDRAARDAVRRWRFVPARQGELGQGRGQERGVAAWVQVPISFSIRS